MALLVANSLIMPSPIEPVPDGSPETEVLNPAAREFFLAVVAPSAIVTPVTTNTRYPSAIFFK